MQKKNYIKKVIMQAAGLRRLRYSAQAHAVK